MKWIAFTGARVDDDPAGLDSPQKLRNSRRMALLPPELKPMRWLAHVPLAILPFLAAAAIQGPQLGPDLQRRVVAALADAGQGWAKIGVLGRDVEIRGLAPDRASVVRAGELAGAVAGVRRVALRAGVEAQ